MVKRKRGRKSKKQTKKVLSGLFGNIEKYADNEGLELSGSVMICTGRGKDKVCAARQYKTGGVYKKGKNKGLPKPDNIYQVGERKRVAMSAKKAAKWNKVKNQTFKPTAKQKRVIDIMKKSAAKCSGAEDYRACMKKALREAHGK